MIKLAVKLTFPENLVREPILGRLVKEFDIEPNIRRANVEEHFGWIICELDGEADAVEKGIEWLRQTGVEVDYLADAAS
jgi:ABC-type methionine transport system ATPase subunit